MINCAAKHILYNLEKAKRLKSQMKFPAERNVLLFLC